MLEEISGKTRCLEYGVIKNHPSLSQESCLVAIHDSLDAAIGRHRPVSLAIEKVIYVQNYTTAIILGSARGAAILSAARRGLAVHEYAPKRVKQAVVGRGAATKDQVAFMIRALLGLTETPPSDAADAIAIGLTHLKTLVSPQGGLVRSSGTPSGQKTVAVLRKNLRSSRP